jgi:Sulfotransferase family
MGVSPPLTAASCWRSMSKLVSIFGCGVQKGGTTSLHDHFCEHPSLSPPSIKETHFFDDETRNWANPNYAALDAFYPSADGDRLRFEITPIYVFWPPSIERIKQYNPDAKLVFLFRDPFERAWSHWCMEYARKAETLSFAESIRSGRARVEGLSRLSDELRVFTYVERGQYAEQVLNVLTHFAREQVLFLRSEDLRDNRMATLNRIAAFLGVGPFPDSGPKRANSRLNVFLSSEPTEADRALVAGIVEGDLRMFSKLTGLDVSNWPSASASRHKIDILANV